MNRFKLNKETGEYESVSSFDIKLTANGFLARELASPAKRQQNPQPQPSESHPAAPVRLSTWTRQRGLSAKSYTPPWKHLERTGLANLSTPQALLEAREEKAMIREALLKLHPREERVVRLRNGLGCEEHSLDAVADKFSLSRERIRQIEAKAYRRMKHKSSLMTKHSFELTVAA